LEGAKWDEFPAELQLWRETEDAEGKFAKMAPLRGRAGQRIPSLYDDGVERLNCQI